MTRSLLAAAALLALGASAQAQSTSPQLATAVEAGDAVLTPRVSDQLVRNLQSADADVRVEALRTVTSMALAFEGLDIRPAVPALLDIVRSDAVEAHRLTALHALDVAGDEAAYRALRAEVDLDASPAVRRTLLRVLVGHVASETLRADPSVVALAQSVLNDA